MKADGSVGRAPQAQKGTPQRTLDMNPAKIGLPLG